MPLFTDFAYPADATGAVSRTTPARIADQINVMDFDADPSGSGSSDNRTAFSAAIAAATPAWPGAGTKAAGRIYIPRGTYNFLGSLDLLPGGPGTFNSFTLVGEAPGCTQLIGNFNGYILDTGTDPFDEGGFIIENLYISNANTTPFTSGCIRMGGIAPTVRGCQLGGRVGVNFYGAKVPSLRDTFMSGGGIPDALDAGAIGVVLAGDGGTVENFHGSGMEICIAMSGTGQFVGGCHFEVSRRMVVAGYGAHGLGLGYSRGVVVQGVSGEGIGIQLDIEGPTVGYFASIGAQRHAEHNINPEPSAPEQADNSLWAVRVQDDTAEGISIIDCGSGFASIDPTGGAFYIGTVPAGFVRSGGCFIKGAGDSPLSADVADMWTVPGSAAGGSAAAGAANCARVVMSNRALIWKYDDLPWGTLTSASITGTALTYSSATRLTLEVGAVLSGSGVTAGTKVTAILTSTTATVTPSQTAGSGTYTFYCNNPGDEYIIGNSSDPLWTGSASNAGKPITTGGGSNQVRVAFKETSGYVIVG